MARPRQEHPTPAELEVLQVVWDCGPSAVREAMEALKAKRRRAYSSVMSLMNVMVDKGLLTRRPRGRAFVYEPKAGRCKTLSAMVADLLGRAFDGSANAMVAHLLEQSRPSADELDQIRQTIASYRRKRGED